VREREREKPFRLRLNGDCLYKYYHILTNHHREVGSRMFVNVG
jgi:hypothetical protein